MKCPRCGYEQYCPCKSCKARIPKNYKPWIERHGDLIECANCGISRHIDWWEDEAVEQYRKEERK